MIVKLSYSILSTWSKGQWEQAVGYYLGQSLPATPAMELGKAKHELWEQQIKETGFVPKELGGDQLDNPVVEQKYEKLIPFSDDIDILIRGVPDVTDGDTVWEWKCGQTSAGAYVDSFQLDYYKLLLPDVKIGIYRCLNPYKGTFTTGIKFLGTSEAENALNHILTYGGEMIDYLASQNLLKDYAKELA